MQGHDKILRMKLQHLNQPQQDAVTTIEQPCLVLAGAGSGKTRTLTYRVARLVEDGVSPDTILLLTFTRKAAQQMILRATKLLDDELQAWRGRTLSEIRYLFRELQADPEARVRVDVVDESLEEVREAVSEAKQKVIESEEQKLRAEADREHAYARMEQLTSSLEQIENERASLADRMAEGVSGTGGKSVEACVEEADFVFTGLRVGGVEARARHEALALKEGLVGQETVGYVSNINKYYVIYRNAFERVEKRKAAVEQVKK